MSRKCALYRRGGSTRHSRDACPTQWWLARPSSPHTNHPLLRINGAFEFRQTRIASWAQRCRVIYLCKAAWARLSPFICHVAWLCGWPIFYYPSCYHATHIGFVLQSWSQIWRSWLGKLSPWEDLGRGRWRSFLHLVRQRTLGCMRHNPWGTWTCLNLKDHG